jgi:eukaryotic-like serine/threonine-protein kinase
MTSDRFAHVEQIFHEARALEPASRAVFLDNACGSDPEVRAEVESLLLYADNQSEDLRLEELQGAGESLPGSEMVTQPYLTARGPVVEGPGAVIDRYKILQKIGEGGFGAVYMAEQTKPVQRKVALKIIKLGMDTKQVIARFEAERQALAMMDHPNIARVLDAGATETGRPYFVMELVRGISIMDYCDRHKLGMRERLELFIPICQAVQHAHQKGIIHRDLKPSNVLVTLHDTVPVPKVIDFGIAKATSHRLTEKTLFTEFRQFVGTPEYMSPDQAEISGLDIDTRTDIYSLGVMLYELLTGTTPFDSDTLRKAAYGEIQRIIREVEPPKPSTRVETLVGSGSDSGLSEKRQVEPRALSKLIKGDLDWIVMKAIEKDRTRRYQTALDLASDIERHLRDEPITAGPPNLSYKLRKYMVRNRVGVLTGGLVAAALLLGLSLATIGFVQAKHEARQRQRVADFLQELFLETSPGADVAPRYYVPQVLAEAREIFGDDHATVAATLSSRAMQLQSASELESAELLYNEALRIWREDMGVENRNVSATLGQLGMLQLTKGDTHAAEETLRQALELSDRLPGGLTLSDAEWQAVLASLLANKSEYDEAKRLLRSALAIRREQGGQDLQYAITANSLANIIVMSGELEGMREAVEETLSAWREALDPFNPFLGQVLVQISIWHMEQQDYETAHSLARQAITIFGESEYYADRYLELAVRVLFASMQRMTEGDPEAMTKLLEVARFAEESVIDNRAVLVEPFSELADDLRFSGEAVVALPLARHVLAFVDPEDAAHAEAVRLLGNVAWDIVKVGDRDRQDYELAQSAIRDALVLDPGSPAFTNTLGATQVRLGEYEQALETLAFSDDWYTVETGTRQPADLAFIAMAQARLGRPEAALATLQELQEVMQQPDLGTRQENQALVREVEQLLRETAGSGA